MKVCLYEIVNGILRKYMEIFNFVCIGSVHPQETDKIILRVIFSGFFFCTTEPAWVCSAAVPFFSGKSSWISTNQFFKPTRTKEGRGFCHEGSGEVMPTPRCSSWVLERKGSEIDNARQNPPDMKGVTSSPSLDSTAWPISTSKRHCFVAVWRVGRASHLYRIFKIILRTVSNAFARRRRVYVAFRVMSVTLPGYMNAIVYHHQLLGPDHFQEPSPCFRAMLRHDDPFRVGNLTRILGLRT